MELKEFIEDGNCSVSRSASYRNSSGSESLNVTSGSYLQIYVGLNANSEQVNSGT